MSTKQVAKLIGRVSQSVQPLQTHAPTHKEAQGLHKSKHTDILSPTHSHTVTHCQPSLLHTLAYAHAHTLCRFLVCYTETETRTAVYTVQSCKHTYEMMHFSAGTRHDGRAGTLPRAAVVLYRRSYRMPVSSCCHISIDTLRLYLDNHMHELSFVVVVIVVVVVVAHRCSFKTPTSTCCPVYSTHLSSSHRHLTPCTRCMRERASI